MTEAIPVDRNEAVDEAIRCLRLKLEVRKERYCTPGMSFSAEVGEVETLIAAVEALRLSATAEAQRYRDGLDAWRANNVTHAVRIKVLEAKLLELAGECAECAGSGTRMTTSGVIESEPCPDCDDIRELLK